ncbi:hypothetical protein LDENG_00244270 [Lucifuga dentata]|nr:hypothetical protein LDENG_00244270 [Lucifuga dentata]
MRSKSEVFHAHFLEHLRSYELFSKNPVELLVSSPQELNDHIPLSLYVVEGCLLLSPCCSESVSISEIRHVTIESLPQSVDDLKDILRNVLSLRDSFILQFEDPEFGNELCNLTSIDELPKDRVTLKVLFTNDSSCSDSTCDTASLSTDSPSPSSDSETLTWPEPFPIPSFSHDVEYKLRVANQAYEKDGSVMTVSKTMKMDILDKLANAMCTYTAYPKREQYESVAQALVAKHPCLRERLVQERAGIAGFLA